MVVFAILQERFVQAQMGKKEDSEDIALNGLSWLCWVLLITLYIFVSFKVFISKDTLRIHLLFSSFQIYSRYIFKEHSALTFILWTQIYAPWNTCLCNFGLCISGLFVEGVWIQTPLFIVSSCFIAGMCKRPHVSRLPLAGRAQDFQPQAKNTRWESVDKISSVMW